MAALESIDAFLAAASRVCCSPFAIFVQIQVRNLLPFLHAVQFSVIRFLFGYKRWSFAAFVRSRVTRRIKHNIDGGNSFGFICDDINDLEHSVQVNLPRVSVVMPLKGFGEHNLQNWRSQITSLYGGPLEYLFVVESVEDPAYPPVSMLISEFKVGPIFSVLIPPWLIVQ
ncbi:hypothetical protein MA16_Dca008339 [Dendrobium catenatum]|uniref:Uncharacterized protein n=1 Tax=Dendrobium catenatum TaxID=906689 RepID=A0A2I0W845_9ASPA|nr:hypothetical protein MA16_Dca008339 [Dendrobium catenatum]